ncbi:MAG: hypothetical protein US98_C0031G0002 [Parcubacteria group bacterium GW2011_GWC1_38_6]|nr:MAG: hypothetical protein US98_C0031G0002 [Parcubacteria group bacterium GW2011_GWC1_38_6]
MEICKEGRQPETGLRSPRCPMRPLLGTIRRLYLPVLVMTLLTILAEVQGIPEKVGVDNLIIGKNGANIRRAPSSIYDADIVGQFEQGVGLPKAFLVIGNDPNNTYDGPKSPRWYVVFQNPERTCAFYLWDKNIDPKSLTPTPH